MAGIFDQPRNAGTLCGLSIPYFAQSDIDRRIQSLEVRKSAVQTYGTRMVWLPKRTDVCHKLRTAVRATQAIANIVKSSFGPSGLDKMMVDDIGVR